MTPSLKERHMKLSAIESDYWSLKNRVVTPNGSGSLESQLRPFTLPYCFNWRCQGLNLEPSKCEADSLLVSHSPSFFYLPKNTFLENERWP